MYGLNMTLKINGNRRAGQGLGKKQEGEHLMKSTDNEADTPSATKDGSPTRMEWLNG